MTGEVVLWSVVQFPNETLDEAKKRETKYTSTMCPTSEIESEDEGALRQKRRSRPNQMYMPSDSDDHSSGDGKRNKFAKPPDNGFPGQIAKSSQSRKVPKSIKPPAVRTLGLEPTMNDSSDGLIYNYVEELQTPDPDNTEMPGIATAHWGPVPPAPGPQHVQQLQDFTATKYKLGYDTTLLFTLNVQMHSVLTEVLVIVKDLSRDVQFIKNELSKGNMTPGGTQGPATTTPLLPFQLPIACEQDFKMRQSHY
ncbi:hypothetical protein CRENBAI_011391 [Crenichthys baileyi]|uniref:Uncharacterized protein n=1 Tax=Crenichthys baileyi TaxID=28760 RepID=A0AAV9QTB7_9TELE